MSSLSLSIVRVCCCCPVLKRSLPFHLSSSSSSHFHSFSKCGRTLSSSSSSSSSVSAAKDILATSSSFSAPSPPRVPMEIVEDGDLNPNPNPQPNPNPKRWWKPMCLYYTQGKCTMMDDALHLDKFNHNYATDLNFQFQPDLGGLDIIDNNHRGRRRRKTTQIPQDFDYLLVLDLEGKVEILEFPVIMIDAKTMEFVDAFHRFVKPVGMTDQRIDEYIQGKYGKLGIDRVWHETSIPFKDVLQEFELWMTTHHLWNKEIGGPLDRAAFVTCGNWDLKTKIPEQCKVSRIEAPPYFMEWINLKDIFLNFYNRRATGMMTMMRELGIPLLGSHHLGIDDTKNITRVVLRLLTDGASLQITARRRSSDPGGVEFLYKNRIR